MVFPLNDWWSLFFSPQFLEVSPGVAAQDTQRQAAGLRSSAGSESIAGRAGPCIRIYLHHFTSYAYDRHTHILHSYVYNQSNIIHIDMHMFICTTLHVLRWMYPTLLVMSPGWILLGGVQCWLRSLRYSLWQFSVAILILQQSSLTMECHPFLIIHELNMVIL